MAEMWVNWWAANELEVWASLVLAAVLLVGFSVMLVVAWWRERRRR